MIRLWAAHTSTLSARQSQRKFFLYCGPSSTLIPSTMVRYHFILLLYIERISHGIHSHFAVTPSTFCHPLCVRADTSMHRNALVIASRSSFERCGMPWNYCLMRANSLVQAISPPIGSLASAAKSMALTCSKTSWATSISSSNSRQRRDGST